VPWEVGANNPTRARILHARLTDGIRIDPPTDGPEQSTFIAVPCHSPLCIHVQIVGVNYPISKTTHPVLEVMSARECRVIQLLLPGRATMRVIRE